MTPRILVANRGEIACRILKSCRDMNLPSVAIYSEADNDALHVQLADESRPVGPAPVRESYLNMDRILDIARSTQTTHIHPGYGLLSENPEFALRVESAGIGWVGPSPGCIAAMADKDRARKIASEENIPVLNGSGRIVPEDAGNFEEIANEIGFPVLVKAVSGGGGIGIRVCNEAHSLDAAANTVFGMAERSFGGSAVIIERFIDCARHVEVQVFGLGDGKVLGLLDRDCSTQRRFQKVIEEAPALLCLTKSGSGCRMQP